MVSGNGTNMSHLILTFRPLCFDAKLQHWNMAEIFVYSLFSLQSGVSLFLHPELSYLHFWLP